MAVGWGRHQSSAFIPMGGAMDFSLEHFRARHPDLRREYALSARAFAVRLAPGAGSRGIDQGSIRAFEAGLRRRFGRTRNPLQRAVGKWPDQMWAEQGRAIWVQMGRERRDRSRGPVEPDALLAESLDEAGIASEAAELWGAEARVYIDAGRVTAWFPSLGDAPAEVLVDERRASLAARFAASFWADRFASLPRTAERCAALETELALSIDRLLPNPRGERTVHNSDYFAHPVMRDAFLRVGFDRWTSDMARGGTHFLMTTTTADGGVEIDDRAPGGRCEYVGAGKVREAVARTAQQSGLDLS